MRRQISDGSTLVATQNQVSSELGKEFVILNLNSGAYFGLEDVGARVWSLLQEPRTLSAIQKTIVDEYAVDPQQCNQDLRTLVGKLIEAGLVEVKNHTLQ